MFVTLGTTLKRQNGITSGDVLPCFAGSCPAHGNQRNTKTFCQFLQRGGRRLAACITNGAHSLFGQLRQMLLLTMSPMTSAFLLFVIGIDLVIPQEQVRGPDTRTVIAVMQDQAVRGDGSVVQFPSDTMRRKNGKEFTVRGSRRIDVAIATISDMPQPKPTSRSQFRMDRTILINAGPKFCRIGQPELTCGASGSHTAKSSTD